MVQPALELGDSDEDTAAATGAELADYVVVDVVAADAEDGGCLVRADRNTP